MRPIIKCLLFVVFCYPSLYGQYYFPPAHGTWQQKDPGEYSIDSGKIAEAIDFAKKMNTVVPKICALRSYADFLKNLTTKFWAQQKKEGAPRG